MRTPFPASLVATAALALTAGVASAQNAPAGQAAAAAAAPSPAASAPDVGQPAPDVTLAWADTSGARSTPVSLSALRGKVVVLAFYPKDRTGGCTAELTKFRDEYTSLFGSRVGTDVVVVPISADGIASHVSWAKDAHYPFALASDTTLAAATAYGSRNDKYPVANRTVFVVGKDGRIVYRDLKFNALSEDAYARVKAAVAAAASGTAVSGK